METLHTLEFLPSEEVEVSVLPLQPEETVRPLVTCMAGEFSGNTCYVDL